MCPRWLQIAILFYHFYHLSPLVLIKDYFSINSSHLLQVSRCFLAAGFKKCAFFLVFGVGIISYKLNAGFKIDFRNSETYYASIATNK
jgi:hypothetical protein